MQNRRSFLGSLVAAATGAMVSGEAAGVSRAVKPVFVTPGLQLYTVRTEMQRDVGRTLAAVAAMGYREVEFAGYFDHTPTQIRELVVEHGLRTPSTHIAYETIASGWDAVLRNAKEIGHDYVTVPSLPGTARASLSALRDTAAMFNRGAAEAKSAGLRFAFHNHDVELRPVENVLPLTVLMQETDPELVSFQLDVYWAFRAGQDPLGLLDAHPRRFSMLHLKDSAGPPEHQMVDVGAGVIDFRAILLRSTAQGLRHFFVEHDRPADAFASIRASRTYLAGLQR